MKMRSLGDEMALAGKPLDDEELVAYILNGLDDEFSPMVRSLVTRVEPVMLVELYSHLFESRANLRHGRGGASSVNAAERGCGAVRGFGCERSNRERGARPGRGTVHHCPNNQQRANTNNQQRVSSSNSSETRLFCQVCYKTGHTANACWHRYDENYVPDPRLVAAATHSYSVDTNWYTNTGATDHITGKLEKLAICDRYNNNDQIHKTGGVGMNFSHIGHSTIHTSSCHLNLNNVLHVPQAIKNLVSIHRLAKDNNVFLEFHPNFFLVKDQDMRSMLLRGPCKQGLYSLPPTPSSSASKKSFWSHETVF